MSGDQQKDQDDGVEGRAQAREKQCLTEGRGEDKLVSLLKELQYHL